MKRIFYTISILLLSINAFAFGTSNDKVLKVYSERNFVPFNFYENDMFVGIGVDVIDEILKDANFIHTKTKVIPWARSYSLAQSQPNVALFSLYRTKSREDLFYWVGPLTKSKIIVLTKVENSFDPKNFKVAAVRDSASMLYALENNIPEKNIMKTNQTDLGLKLLNLDRVDAWVIDYHTAVKTIKDNKLNTNDYYVYETLAENDIYIALSKKTDIHIKNYFTEKMDEFRKNGFLEKTLDKYNFSNTDVFTK